MTPEELVAALRRTLREIIELVPESRTAWDASRTLQLAVLKLWIDAGNYAEEYRKALDIESWVGPWSDLYAYRCVLAHQLPEELNQDRLWSDSRDAAEILAATDEPTASNN